MRVLSAIVQVGVLSLAYLGADALARALHSPIPGNVLGAILLAVLLLAGVVPLRAIEAGADLLLRWLPLFFVPAAVLAARSWPVIRSELLAIVAVMVLTLVLVMVVTGKLAARFEERKGDP